MTVSSYHLRDRAIVTDSLLLRKHMIFAFKSTLPLELVRGGYAAGTLLHDGAVLAVDTTWLFDQSAGNLGFGLPYAIPDGGFELRIVLADKSGQPLDSLSGTFNRRDLKMFYNREVNYWDFTTPFAHLECTGYGAITYRFQSSAAYQAAGLTLTARISSDNGKPVTARLAVNGVDAGALTLPAADNDKPPVVNAKLDQVNIAVQKGLNEFTISIPDEAHQDGGMGIRIYDRKNQPEAEGEELPLKLSVQPAAGAAVEYAIPVWGEDGENITARFNSPVSAKFTRAAQPGDTAPLDVGPADIAAGCVIFSRHWQHYVYPWTVPADSERVSSLHAVAGRHDFEPLTFSLYPLRDMGEVRIVPHELTGPGGAKIPASSMRVHVVRPVKMRTGRGNEYRLVPRLLERANQTSAPIGSTTRFWVTVVTDSSQAAGTYRGTIGIELEREADVALPVTVEIVPVTLEAVPDIEYSMFMTYEFFELESKDLNEEQKRRVYDDGVATFRDYLDHGMSTVDVSTPYYFQWNADGTPRIEHLKATLAAARDVGITRPVYWYYAHYLQAAKSTHPGNTTRWCTPGAPACWPAPPWSLTARSAGRR